MLNTRLSNFKVTRGHCLPSVQRALIHARSRDATVCHVFDRFTERSIKAVMLSQSKAKELQAHEVSDANGLFLTVQPELGFFRESRTSVLAYGFVWFLSVSSAACLPACQIRGVVHVWMVKLRQFVHRQHVFFTRASAGCHRTLAARSCRGGNCSNICCKEHLVFGRDWPHSGASDAACQGCCRDTEQQRQRRDQSIRICQGCTTDLRSCGKRGCDSFNILQ